MRPSDLVTFGRSLLQRVGRHLPWVAAIAGSNGRRILDIGSGHRPHRDATHLLELHLRDDTERGRGLKVLGKILVQGNVEALPFKDKSFDYAYACHVLEHVTAPEHACSELMRVARAGYVETPDPFYEQGYSYPALEGRGWPFHRWFVWVNEAGTLIFEPKDAETLQTFCECRHANFVRKVYEFVESRKRNKERGLNRLHRVLPKPCNYTQLEWVDHFNFEVRGSVGAAQGLQGQPGQDRAD